MDFDLDVLGQDGLTRIMEGVAWFEEKAANLTASAQQNANYYYYALQNWVLRHRANEGIPAHLWNQLQTLSRGYWLRNLGSSVTNPAEEDWEMIQVKSNRRMSFTVNIYEEHDLIEDD